MTDCRSTTPTQPPAGSTSHVAPEPSATSAVDGHPASAVDFERPDAVRMYEYYLGSCHNFAVDRRAAQAVMAAVPRIVETARANRDFHRRAVRYALREGVAQFLDLGAGIPVYGGTHEIVRAAHPAAPVV